jgi:hypothetical protein
MGYACPVCSDPQADAGHLANHLAFTAMLGDDDHEVWLDEHAPGWNRMGEAELADALVDQLEETEFPQLFEDTAGGLESESEEPPEERSGALFEADRDRARGHHHEHGHGHAHEHDAVPESSAPVDEETAEILAEARELTRRMYEDGGDDRETEGGEQEARTDDGG